MSSELNQMSAVQVAPSGECSQGRGRYGVVCRGNPVWSIPERLELKFHERRYTSTLYLYLPLPIYVVCSLSLADTTRLQTLIQILASEVSSDIADSGHQYAMTHAASTLQSCSAAREEMSGLTQVTGVQILFSSFIAAEARAVLVCLMYYKCIVCIARWYFPCLVFFMYWYSIWKQPS